MAKSTFWTTLYKTVDVNGITGCAHIYKPVFEEHDYLSHGGGTSREVLAVYHLICFVFLHGNMGDGKSAPVYTLNRIFTLIWGRY